MVTALIDRTLTRISSRSLKCPLRSSAGSKIGTSALKRLPHTRSEASRNTQRSPRCFVIKRRSVAYLTSLSRGNPVPDPYLQFLVITGRRYKLVKNFTLCLVGTFAVATSCSRLDSRPENLLRQSGRHRAQSARFRRLAPAISAA
jgi:hypothetical protein